MINYKLLKARKESKKGDMKGRGEKQEKENEQVKVSERGYNGAGYRGTGDR